MELGTTIIGLMGLIICIAPVILLRRSRKNKEKELFTALQQIAGSCGKEVGQYECGMEFIIGLSNDNASVFFYKKRNETELKEVIHLETVRKCSVNTIRKSSGDKKSTETVIDKLELVFDPKGKNNRTILRLELFNSTEFFQPTGELQIAQKWESIINSNL